MDNIDNGDYIDSEDYIDINNLEHFRQKFSPEIQDSTQFSCFTATDQDFYSFSNLFCHSLNNL
jgi:hypothetical protein